MLDDALLQAFMDRFFGYGSLEADFWFVGMEEGGGNTERELHQRLDRWDDLGRPSVVDNYEFHRAVEEEPGKSMVYFFEGRPKIQRTWAGLIRILLAVEGQTDDSAEAVRQTQADRWGRAGPDNCLLELLPLPSPGVGQWRYGGWSTLKHLRSRDAYRARMRSRRIAALARLVRQAKPACVVFYSASADYLEAWSQIAGGGLADVEPQLMATGNQGQRFTARFLASGDTLFVNTYHPVYTGLTKGYFRAVGTYIREHIRSNRASIHPGVS